jgi:quercetin dioxygenase-like cupin family protein
MPFSSKDFATTSAILESQLPGRLVHRDVRQRFHGGFSQERGHGVAIVDLPSRSISVTIGHLKEGQRTRLHRHNYETIIYVVKGCGYSLVENEKVEWKAGDALYVPVWAWHRHVNTGDDEAEYVACENAPLLQNLDIALREEAPIND